MSMTRIEEAYHGFHIHGELLPVTGDYNSWLFSVDDQSNSRQFTLKSKVSRSAAPQNTVELARDIGLHRSRGMIDLQTYELGKAYEHTVTTYSPQASEVPNEQVRQLLLKALYNIYRIQPTRAQLEQLDVDGFCQIVGINTSSYEYNASVLKGKGYIDESPIQQLSISNGGIYISPSGIDVVENALQAPTPDTPFSGEKDRQRFSLGMSNQPLLSKESVKLLSVMSEVAMRDGVYSLLCIESPSPRHLSRWDYQIQGAPEQEALNAEDITGGAMNELCAANFVQKTPNKNIYLLLRAGLEWFQSERNNQLRRQILEAVTALQKEEGESYIKDASIANKLGLDLEDTQDYLEIISKEGYLEIVHTFGGSQVTLSSQGRMALKNPQFISTSHQVPTFTKTQPSTAATEAIESHHLPDQHITKILFLAANPLDTTRLRLDAERRAVDQALRRAEHRNFRVEQHSAVRVTDLQELLLRHQPDIVHFSGHGSHTSEIILEDNSGNGRTVSTRALAQLFSLLKDNIRCVVLNACYSESQAQAIAQHIDCVIGIPGAIGDEQSISFSMAFYQALGYGRNLQNAFDLGCLQIHMENLGDGDILKLISPKANPSEIVLTKGR